MADALMLYKKQNEELQAKIKNFENEKPLFTNPVERVIPAAASKRLKVINPGQEEAPKTNNSFITKLNKIQADSMAEQQAYRALPSNVLNKRSEFLAQYF